MPTYQWCAKHRCSNELVWGSCGKDDIGWIQTSECLYSCLTVWKTTTPPRKPHVSHYTPQDAEILTICTWKKGLPVLRIIRTVNLPTHGPHHPTFQHIATQHADLTHLAEAHVLKIFTGVQLEFRYVFGAPLYHDASWSKALSRWRLDRCSGESISYHTHLFRPKRYENPEQGIKTVHLGMK